MISAKTSAGWLQLLCAAFTLVIVCQVVICKEVQQQRSESGWARTTAYWDCCKPACGWRSNVGDVSSGPVRSCWADGWNAVDANEQSGCDGGNAYVCNDQTPFFRDGQAYAFAAANINDQPQESLCCACFRLTFADTAAKGQVLTVQVINTGVDLERNHYDLQIPGGGFGLFTQACPRQWPWTPSWAWGKQYGGVQNREGCYNLAPPLVEGCLFRFDWMKGADNPSANFERVPCPSALTDVSKCRRNDE